MDAAAPAAAAPAAAPAVVVVRRDPAALLCFADGPNKDVLSRCISVRHLAMMHRDNRKIVFTLSFGATTWCEYPSRAAAVDALNEYRNMVEHMHARSCSRKRARVDSESDSE